MGPSWSGLGKLLGSLGASESRNSEKAKNIEKSDIKNQITYLETYILLKKHHVGLMVQAIDKHQLINTTIIHIINQQA